MASVSSESLATARAALEGSRDSVSLKTATDLFGVLGVLDENPALQRALTDPARSTEERGALARRLFSGQVSDIVVDLAAQVAGSRFSSMGDFLDTFETLGVDATCLVAERGGETGIARLEDELFAFRNAVGDSHELQRALSMVSAPRESRERLAQGLTAHVSEPARVLITQAVLSPRGLKVVTLVERFSQFVAARHNLWIAHVETSQELTPEQGQRLAEALTRYFGRELKINATTLPSLIGGVRITVGDEVIDSSALAHINRLKQRLAS
ncbi:F0F1 ATP synthase subunit delta [Falsarthrobacter nasiphocae]|uniref:ATP synthase subunit delta n=1 Tax=Falsarthrobacter nasiphocae TaxID=189863 RepID=A0AAE4C721_9MICC|nr:F0F1 ATP synthase subunit delta [Falsarthrobacter nasiphocae]MDR6892777.1 F-type H+-transporting ATPase subunit delta [Falsarthrobacter nasiphocae]